VKHSDASPLAFLDDELAALDASGLLRPRKPARRPELSFCSNDYLGLARRLASPAAAGAGASRLVSGEREEHAALERELTAWLGYPAAITFTSGYAANVGVLSALARPGDLIVSDGLNHASIIDGARLSRAEVVVVPHLDVEAVGRALEGRGDRRAWVVTESYFSMDADAPDLRRLRDLCDAAGAALVVDEAHAIGVLGPEGRGLCAEAGVQPDVLVGTFGKAFGAAGAFVAGRESLALWLWNRARSFVFSTGLSPVLARAALDGVRIACADAERRERVLAAARSLRTGLKDIGVQPWGFGQIIPWVVGAPERACAVASALREKGLDVAAIRPPSVPQGTSRLRLTVTADHGPADIARALEAIGEVIGCVRR
jgi:8-amino-7-oxononanoate synthase